MERFVDEKTVAESLQMSLAAIRRWRYQGTGPKFRKFGASVRYSITDLEAWIGSCQTGAAR